MAASVITSPATSRTVGDPSSVFMTFGASVPVA
jgi:hypothetical protein